LGKLTVGLQSAACCSSQPTTHNLLTVTYVEGQLPGALSLFSFEEANSGTPKCTSSMLWQPTNKTEIVFQGLSLTCVKGHLPGAFSLLRLGEAHSMAISSMYQQPNNNKELLTVTCVEGHLPSALSLFRVGELRVGPITAMLYQSVHDT
jgi:hypothetical protein